MISHVMALADVLRARGLNVHCYDVVGRHPPLPYVLLWSTGGRPQAAALAGQATDLDERLYATVVDDCAENLQLSLPRVREAIQAARLEVPGWQVDAVHLIDSTTIVPDREVTLPQTSAHPLYCVDTYRLRSQRR